MAGTAPAKERLDFLDVARGVAAFFVLLEHGLGVFFPGFRTWSAHHQFSLGRCGVVLFLVVSGFIIPKSLEQSGSQAAFWLRRFFRLFPAYWLSIALAFAVAEIGLARPQLPVGETADWLLNLTMLQGFFNRPHVWGVFWTLQLELVIYAACSTLYAVGLLRRAGWLVGVVIVGFLTVGVVRPFVEGKPFEIGGSRMLYWGPMAGLIAQRCLAEKIRVRGLCAILFGQAAAVAAVWVVNHTLFPHRVTVEGLREFTCTWGSAYAVFFALLAARDRPMPAIGRWLGRISYSIYLLHPLVLIVTHGYLPAWLFWPAFLLGTLALAEISHRIVETPGIALGRALEKRWLPAARQRPLAAAPAGRRAA